MSKASVFGFLEDDRGVVVGGPFWVSFVPKWNQSEVGISLEGPVMLMFICIGKRWESFLMMTGDEESNDQ